MIFSFGVLRLDAAIPLNKGKTSYQKLRRKKIYEISSEEAGLFE